ncbi:MAG: tRNA 5-methoxyuridine(34)/uridine 5-oxyacetic acid(34) synthase CmoB [Helicobacter sp.]|nr:tRNA 5-methoxyuridine(34)/uridine 5-oxyacetic acid(34) synthase CmoB [Helicobacter sp.]
MRLKNKKLDNLLQIIHSLPRADSASFGDVIHINLPKNTDQNMLDIIEQCALNLRPWRKGPFQIGDLLIDSEWKSYIKYNAIFEKLDLDGKIIADVGCNNGYYMLRSAQKALEVIGFDPGELFFAQFHFIWHFLKDLNKNVSFHLDGVDEAAIKWPKYFDVIFCLGVIYHRPNPILCLKSLTKMLKNDESYIVLDTLIYQSDLEICLSPKSYAGMNNVYFIPSIKALENWCFKAKLKIEKIIDITKTTPNEQRKTKWILGHSLEEFLQKTPQCDTEIEPTRAYFRIKKA